MQDSQEQNWVLYVPFIVEPGFKLSEEREAVFAGMNCRFRQGSFDYIDMKIEGIESEQAARELFPKVRAALFAACLTTAWGIKVRDEVKVIPEGSSLSEALGSSLVGNTGLPFIYKEGQDLRRLVGQVGPRGTNIDRVWPKFMETLEVAFASQFERALIDERVMLAFELYVDSYFERSDSARFIGLVGVLEVLKDKDSVSKPAQEMIKNWREAAKSLADDEEKNSIYGSLEYLMRLSISRGIRFVVKRHLGEDAAREATVLYDMRSKLVHDGKRLTDPYNAVRRAQQLVMDLLAHILMTGSL